MLPVQKVERVLFVTSELTDLVKAGGLGEVSAYLPRVLRDGGVDTRIMIPGYRQVLAKIGTPHVVADLPGLNAIPPCKIALTYADDGLPVYVVLAPELYDRPGSPYGDESARDWADNDLRFARLALAAADIATGTRNGASGSWTADVVHVNDWASALTPAYLAWRGQRVPSILTIHNLAYQGLFERNRLTALASTPEPEAFVEKFLKRIEALGRTHGLLSREHWGNVQLRDVASEALEPYIIEDKARVVLNGPPVAIQPKAAVALGIVFHELATNAVKHGSLSNNDGIVTVQWDWSRDDSDAIALQWGETQGPKVNPPTRKGFGSKLIRLELTHELNGNIEMAYEETGFRAMMCFPTAPRGEGAATPAEAQSA